MEEKIQAISAQLQHGISEDAIKSIEDRIMRKVTEAISDLSAGLQRAETKLEMLGPLTESLALAHIDARDQIASLEKQMEMKLEALAPLTESLALAHIDTRDQIASLGAAVLDLQDPKDDLFVSMVGDAIADLNAGLKRAEAKTNGTIAPMLESLALAQIEMKAKFEGPSKPDDIQLKEKLASLEERIEAKLEGLGARRSFEDTEVQSKIASLEQRIQAVTSREAKKDVLSLNNTVPAYLLDTGFETDSSPVWQGVDYPKDSSEHLAASLSKKSPFMKQVRSSSESRAQALEGSKAELTPGRSKKLHREKKMSAEGERADSMSMSVPFARTIGSRTLERHSGGRSLPYLPPMF